MSPYASALFLLFTLFAGIIVYIAWMYWREGMDKFQVDFGIVGSDANMALFLEEMPVKGQGITFSHGVVAGKTTLNEEFFATDFRVADVWIHHAKIFEIGMNTDIGVPTHIHRKVWLQKCNMIP